MISTGNFNFVDIDFDAYKNSLKDFLRSQSVFRDYDFEGSNINVLLDVLAYNTFKNTFFLNMALSEGFLDSAQLLNSVRSHAKELNYLPRSATSPLARVSVTFDATGENEPYIIQKGQAFSTVIKNGSFIYTVPNTLTATKVSSGKYSFDTDIYEGIYVKDSYIFQSDEVDPQPKFAITNPNVDVSSLVVQVYEDGSVLGDSYKLTTSLLDINGLSKVFFVQPSAITGNYEVLFGDSILGRQPKNGSTIILDYRVTNGPAGNGASLFNINFDPTGSFQESTNIDVSTVTNATGGFQVEDIETTRFYAPRYFQTQERAIVNTDYEILLKQKFPEINAVVAYGGETLNPPQFGKVVISVDLTNIQGLPTSRQVAYFNFLKGRNPINIVPIFIASEHTYIAVDSIIRYNINVTNESPDRIKTLVLAAISAYNTQFLNDFNSTFRFSNFTHAIDLADVSIVSNLTKITLLKKFNPVLQVPQNIQLNFAQPLVNDLGVQPSTHLVTVEKTLTSSSFQFRGSACNLEDDGAGIVRIVTVRDTNYITLDKAGTVDYSTGIVNLNNFTIDSFEGDNLLIYVRQRDDDVNTHQNVILSIDPSNVSMTVQPLTI